ncbi:MAG: hypothetical protein Kow0029_06510 [Candidatus Rifleibacteriota bacterium]
MSANLSNKQLQTLKKRAFFSILTAIFLIIAGCIGFYLGWKQVKAPILLVLNFHGITDSPSAPWETNYSDLEHILNTMKRNDYEFLSPQAFESALKSRVHEGRKLLVTFDDGLKSSAEAIKKLYKEKGISCAFFIVNDFIGKENYVNKEDLVDLANNYNCKIGLHGQRHYEITKILNENVDLGQELEQAKEQLSAIISRPVTWYAYPFGDYNASATRVIASSSFEIAFTIDGYNIDPDVDFKLVPRIMYLRGGANAGAPDPLDWAPPKIARNGSLTITLACLVFFISLSWIFRSINLLKFVRKVKEEQSSL